MTRLADLLSELRTQEARGEGTDPRLVLLEAILVEGRLHALDQYIATLAGAYPGMARALRDDEPVVGELGEAWRGVELEEHSLRLRELGDVLSLLIPNPVGP